MSKKTLGALLILLGSIFILVLISARYEKVDQSLVDSHVTDSKTQDVFQQNDTNTVNIAQTLHLPLSGIVSEENVPFTIPIEEIRRGCFKQDCIPSVDNPTFVSPSDLAGVLDPESIGIALSYKDENRFYPFPMLETHELVNDVIAGDPVLISYCPLCGAGIVFDRSIDGEAVEFGVSGMLWQSNLLMYNRAASQIEQNLWSQVLGQAVVGNRAGERLQIIASDIMQFGEWKNKHPDGVVLTTGAPQDPYQGAYFEVAQSFNPGFDPLVASISPDTYVYGIVVQGQSVAVIKEDISIGSHTFEFTDIKVTATVSESGEVVFTDETGGILSDVEGFWFSWQSAHPDTIILYSQS